MSLHVKVIFKVLPGETGRRAVGGQAGSIRAQSHVEAAPPRSGEPGPRLSAVGCEDALELAGGERERNPGGGG